MDVVISVLFEFQLKVHQELRNKVGSLGLDEHLVAFEPNREPSDSCHNALTH